MKKILGIFGIILCITGCSSTEKPLENQVFKEITDINFNAFVAYRHLIAVAFTFQDDHGKSVYHYLKKYGLF